MKMRKHFAAAAAAVGPGVGAASLPAGGMPLPKARAGLFASALGTTLPLFGRVLPGQRESAGGGPNALDHRCTGTPSFFVPLAPWRAGDRPAGS